MIRDGEDRLCVDAVASGIPCYHISENTDLQGSHT